MSVRDLQPLEITAFGGAVVFKDSRAVPLGKAQRADNCEFEGDHVMTRLGFGQAYNANEAMSALFNWVGSLGNRAVWLRTSDKVLRLLDIETAVITSLPSALTGAAGVSFVNAGSRLYVAGFDSNGVGAAGAGRVISFASPTWNSDPLFQGPITYAPSAPTEPSAGRVTAGAHKFGYRIEFQSGFTTRPSPDSGAAAVAYNTFSPVSFTTAGAKNLSWTLNPPGAGWPAGARRVHVIQNTVSNPAAYHFVPGAFQPLGGGGAQSVTITWDITDDELLAAGTDCTRDLNLLTANAAGTAPFNVAVAVGYGDRHVYISRLPDVLGNMFGVAYVSEIGKQQAIFGASSLVTLNGNLDIVTAFVLGNGLYLLGPNWTFQTEATAGVPVSWPKRLIDGDRGTLAPRGVTVSPSGLYAWIVDRGGLYYFDGSYPSRPVSHDQPEDWRRINWQAASTIQVVDISEKQLVALLVPLDGATSPTHLMTWDYQNGYEPAETNYSLWELRAFSPSAIEVMQNTLSGQPATNYKRQELWIGSSTAAPLLRQHSDDDTNPSRDNGYPIFGRYDTALLPPQRNGGQMVKHHRFDLRVKGGGKIRPVTYSLDKGRRYVMQYIHPAAQPDGEINKLTNLTSEGAFYSFDSNLAVDGGFEYGSGYWISYFGSPSSFTIVSDGNARSGSYAAKKTAAIAIEVFTNTTGQLSTFETSGLSGGGFAVAPGELYYCECWVKSTASADGQAGVRIEFYDAANVDMPGTEIQDYLNNSPSTTYTRLRAVGTVPALAVKARVEIFGFNHTAGTYWFDDVAAAKVDSNFRLSYLKAHYATYAQSR